MGKSWRGKFPFMVLLGVLLGSNAHSEPGMPRHFHVVPGQQPPPHHQHHPPEGICSSVVRRTVVGQQMVTYPCFRPIPGAVPQVAHQSPMGLVCQGYIRVPRPEYYRVVTCCPGWKRNPATGACVKPNRELIVQRTLQPKRLEDLTPYPASYENKRAQVMQQLRHRPLARFGNSMYQWAPRAMILRQMQMVLEQIKMIAKLKREMISRRLPSPLTPSSHLSPNIPPLSPQGKKILHIIRTLKPKLQKPNKQEMKPSKPPQVINKPFPIIPRQRPRMHMPPQSQGFMGRFRGPMFLPRMIPNFPHRQRIPDLSTNDLRPNPSVEAMQAFPQLPKFPVEMPPVQVQPGPNSPFHGHNCMFKRKLSSALQLIPSFAFQGLPAPPPCFAGYVKLVKKCLKNANVELPAEHNFMPGQSSYDQTGVCEKRQEIQECIMGNLRPCDSLGEQILVRRTLAETLIEINRDCQFHDLESIESRLVNEPGPDSVQTKLEPPKQPERKTEHIQPKPNPKPKVVVASIEKAEAKTPSVKKIDQVEQKTPVQNSGINEKVVNNNAPHTHPIHVEDLSHEYYLPLLIGTTIGVAAILILLSALFCICCRRRIRKKIYIEKEPEKPKLIDGIYTIGVPPPVYEVNGIPPISYEEAKGEKITGSPSSLRRHNMENEAIDQTETSRKGVVSDI